MVDVEESLTVSEFVRSHGFALHTQQYQEDAMEKMRAAIRERAADMGIEKSKVTADYIARREKQALEGGPPGAQSDPDSFGGLDLTQISQVKQTNSDWDEDMPTMFYDAADDLSKDEQEEVDPVMLKNPVEQGLNELANAKWPDPLSALREVAIMFLIVGFSTLVITNWDNVLRGVYTGFGFIPTPEEVANYANRFDGLDLPSGKSVTPIRVASRSIIVFGWLSVVVCPFC